MNDKFFKQSTFVFITINTFKDKVVQKHGEKQ